MGTSQRSRRDSENGPVPRLAVPASTIDLPERAGDRAADAGHLK
ncbi:hypothetical protein [Pseudonocardia aurantiaca]